MNDTQILEYILGLFQEGDWNDRSNTLSFDAMFDRRGQPFTYHWNGDHGKYLIAKVRQMREQEKQAAGLLLTERIANERRCRIAERGG